MTIVRLDRRLATRGTGVYSRVLTDSVIVQDSSSAAYVSGDGGPAAPTYTPVWMSNFTGSTLGQEPIASEWRFGQNASLKCNNDIPGPFGESKIAKLIVPGGGAYSQTYFFGGGWNETNFTLTDGDDVWIRQYQRFTAAFCAGYSNTSGNNDGYGNTKWIRMYFDEHPFWVFHLENFSEGSCNVNGPRVGDIETDTGIAGFEGAGVVLARDEWIALQIHVRCSSVAANAFCRVWLGETYLGQLSGASLTTHAGGSKSCYVRLGDYWNGGSLQESIVYIGDSIITKETPNTLDSGGRAYIHPLHKKADF